MEHFRYFSFMSRTILSILFLALLLACHVSEESNDQPTQRPNIVWLVSEDNSKHFLKLYDEKGVSMPAIEKLAAHGLVFNHAFSNAPVCSVARSTIISGCYAPRIGAQYHRRMSKVNLPGDLQMFPYYLQAAGYYTTNNAKEDYNIHKGDSVWNESSKKASYRNRPGGSPFFHVQNFGVTHEGQLHFDQSQIKDRPTVTDPESITPFPYHPNTPTSRYTYARLLDRHLKLDSLLSNFIDQLEADGLMDNTFIFYYGDHGGVLPRSKGYVYESGLHVPLIVYVPPSFRHLVPNKLGSRMDGFVSFIDLGPTVLNLAGIQVPDEMDGSPFLGGNVSIEQLEERDTAFGYADRFDEKYDLVRTIRIGNFKYMRSYQPFNVDALHNFYRYRMLMFEEWRNLWRSNQLNEVQQLFFQPRLAEALYDLSDDPHEINNLAADPALESQLLQLRGALQAKVKDMPDLSFYPEPYFLDHGIHDPVLFGQERKSEIGKLVDIADLALSPYNQVRGEIEDHLKSDNPWIRYWALITCSVFGEDAREFGEEIGEIAANDNENLVRIRALEFLTLHGMTVPAKLFRDVLGAASSMAEANMILNTLALLKEVVPDFKVPELASVVPKEWTPKEKSLVAHRLEYLN